MKQFFLLKACALASLLSIAGCGEESSSSRVSKDVIETTFSSNISIITVDSCEYVWRKVGYGAGLAHKGNCKYCAARNTANNSNLKP